MTEHHVSGEFNREVLLGNGNGAAGLAVNHGNGGAPIPLTGNQPRSNLPVDGLVAAAALFKGAADGLLGFPAVQAVKPFHRAVDHPTEVNFGLVQGGLGVTAFFHHEHALDGNFVLRGKVVVPLIVAWDGHDSARAVGGDDEIADPDGHVFTR